MNKSTVFRRDISFSIIYRVILCMVFIVATESANVVLCKNPDNTPNDNLCKNAEDSSGNAAPNCVNTGTWKDPTWVCRSCLVNCDCKTGYYCVKTPGSTAGNCVGLDSAKNRIGSTCNTFGLLGTPGARIPRFGYDDAMVCGLPIFSTDKTFLGYEWLGSCVNGKCQECGTDYMSWSIATSIGLLPGAFSSIPFEHNGTQFPATSGSLVCGERYCEYGTIRYSRSWLEASFPTGVITGILVFVIFIFFIVLIGCLSECFSRWNERRRLKRPQVNRNSLSKQQQQQQQQQSNDLEAETSLFQVDEKEK
jgi:hypothetical protein